MSIQIIGPSGNVQEVNAGKSAFVTLYDAAGRQLQPASTGSYMTSIEVRHTGAAAAGATVFNMRGPASKTALIRRIFGTFGFDGTALAASGTLRYGVYRGSGAASPTGGAAKGAATGKKRSSYGNWTCQDIRQDITGAGLTTTGITYETDPLAVFSCPVVSLIIAAPASGASSGQVVPVEIPFVNALDPDGFLELGTSDHLALRVQTVATIIGLTFCGQIEWDERL